MIRHSATVVVITHNATIAQLADRVIRVKNGAIDSIDLCDSPANVEDIVW